MSFFKDKLLLVSILLIGVLLFPFIGLFFYTHPQTDDYYFAFHAGQMGLFEFIKSMYFTWSGRYFSMFLGYLNPWVYHSLLFYQLSLLMILLIQLASIYRMLQVVFQSISAINRFVWSLFALFLMIQTSPDLFEMLYWYPSSSAYMLSFSIYLLLLAELVAFARDQIGALRFISFVTLYLIMLAGQLEAIFPMVGFTFLWFLFFSEIQAPQKKILIAANLLLFILFATISAVAPGNFIRFSHEAEHLHFIEPLIISFKSLGLLYFHFFQNPIWLISLASFILFLLVNSSLLAKWHAKILHPFLLGFLSIAVLFASFFLVVLALNAVPPGRIFVLFGFFLMLLSFLNAINLVKYIFSRVSINFQLPKQMLGYLLLLIFIISLSGIHVSDPKKWVEADMHHKKDWMYFSSNWSAAIYTLGTEASDFLSYYKGYDRSLQKAQHKNQHRLVLKPRYNYSRILMQNDAKEYEGQWYYNSESIYYQVDSLFQMKSTP